MYQMYIDKSHKFQCSIIGMLTICISRTDNLNRFVLNNLQSFLARLTRISPNYNAISYL